MLLTLSTVSTRSLYLSRTAVATLAICLSASAHAQSGNADSGEQSTIIVTGARQAQRDAITEKRDAGNTVETLRANDVGKLPDQNVAEAVKRLPGLSVANDQGEGRYVIIRGIDPNLINVTLNGQTLPAPEPAGRVVKLDDLPSAMIQAITVTKSLLPSQDANAVGGEVNIRTKTAFDNARPFFLDARASSGLYGLNRKFPYEMDGTVGGRFGPAEQFGAVVSVNYSNRPIESENFQGSEDYSHGGIPDGNGLRDYNLTRTRLGIVGNFDWHPSDGVKLYLRTSYSKFEDHETRDQNRLAITDYGNDPLAGTATMLVRRREENDNTKSATLGGEFDVAGGKLEMSGGWTKAVKEDPLRSEFTFTSKKGSVAIDYDAGTYPYMLVPTRSSAGLFTTPSLFTLSKYNLEQRYAYEELWQGRADYDHPIAIGDGSSIKVGVKYLDRHKSNDQNKTDYKNGSTVFNASSVAYQGNSDFYDGLFGFGNRIDYWAARAYAAANPSVLKIDAASTLSDSLSSDYDVTESIIAGYAMATLKFGGLTLIPGVRVEHTVDHSKAKIVDTNSTLDDDYNSFGHTSYTDVFPGLNAKFAVNPSLLLRGAVTTSIGRPNYASLAPYVVVEDDTVPNISIGNTGLKPYKAVNYDASIEFYPNKDSLFSAGFFHKDIDNPIYDYSQRLTNVTYGNVDYATVDVSQPVNADSETLTGVELNAQTQFTFLPGLLSGLGLSANYTHIWGHATASAIRSGNIPLFYQSSNVGNVQLFYEKYNLAVRLAFNYRSAYLDALGSDAGTDEYTDGNGQLDLHASYQVTPQFSLFTDISNLTDAPWRRYIGSKPDLIEREHYGAQYRIGVQLHF